MCKHAANTTDEKTQMKAKTSHQVIHISRKFCHYSHSAAGEYIREASRKNFSEVCCRRASTADVDGREWRRSGDAVAPADDVRVELSGVSMSVSALVVQVDHLSFCICIISEYVPLTSVPRTSSV